MSPASSSSSALRVLFADVSGRRGGAEASLDELLAALVARGGLSCVLASARAKEEVSVPCPVHPLPAVRLHRPSRHALPFLRSLAALLRVRRALAHLLHEIRPDIVHTNSLAALLALPRTHAHVVWHVRDWPRNPYATLAASRCDALLAISRPVADVLCGLLPARLRNRVRLVENGIDLARLPFPPADGARRRARAALGLPPEGTVVGMVAHLVPWKRHDLLLAAAARLRAVRDAAGRPITWVLAGSDLFGEHAAYVAALRRFVAEAGLSTCVRWVEGEDAHALLPAFDLLVHPAAEEPFGRVVCEAMACGVPVVACDAAGPGDLLANGCTGFLVPPGPAFGAPSPDALAARIGQALAQTDARAAIARAAAAAVRARSDIGRVADDVSALYRAIVGTNPACDPTTKVS